MALTESIEFYSVAHILKEPWFLTNLMKTQENKIYET